MGELAGIAAGTVARKKALREVSEKVNGAKLGLTERQRQLMTLVAQGMTNKWIASKLNLSAFTVKNHNRPGN